MPNIEGRKFRFGVQNLRRLDCVAPVEIKPITVLVGRNSSGKSTFLRALPLLRQSITTRTSSPVLWYGDWVDFGDFERAVFGNDSAKTITFTFGADSVERSQIYYSPDDFLVFEPNRSPFSDLALNICVSKHGEGTKIASLELRESSNEVFYSLVVGDDGRVSKLSIDGHDMTSKLNALDMIISPGSILPTIIVNQKGKERAQGVEFRPINEFAASISVLEKFVAPYLDRRIGTETLQRLVGPLLNLSVVSRDTLREQAGHTKNRSWAKFLRDMSEGRRLTLFEQFRRELLFAILPVLCNSAARAFRGYISSTLYVGPARARSDRYHRYQDLAVSEIDPDGKNFPMFLNSLSDAEITDFSGWVKELFGYGVTVVRGAGHISIHLEYDYSTVNVVDTGYGVSQILPVLGQVWWANNRPQSSGSIRTPSEDPIIAIEQPELHLHPAHQALLADAFVNSIRSNDGGGHRRRRRHNTHFLIETHSEALINRLGALVAEGKIAPNHVQILVFDSGDKEQRNTSVTIAKFDPDGQLLDWPYGFFVPSV